MEILEPGLFQAKLREYEARLIREALQRASGNQAREFKRHISPEWPLVS